MTPPTSLPLQIEDASAEPFGLRETDDAYLYHVTSTDRVKQILTRGLTPKAKATVQGGAYQSYSRGKTFFTERSGVDYWKDRIEQHLFHAHDNPPEVAVLRVPRALVRDLQVDELGAKDSQHPAYYTERPVPATQDARLIAFHGTRVMPEFTEFSCDGPPVDEEGENVSTGSGPDTTAYMGAHFAKEEAVARKFAIGKEGWLRTRFWGEKTNPRVLRCALTLKNPLQIGSEEELRDLAYRHPLTDDYLLEPAMRKDGVEPETAEADAWYAAYDKDEARRLEVNRWTFENCPHADDAAHGELERLSLCDGARDLAQLAVADLRKKGHDGVIYRNAVEGGTALMIFSPEQAQILSVEYLQEKQSPGVSADETVATKLLSGQAQLAPPSAPEKPSRFSLEQAQVLTAMTKRTGKFFAWVCELYGDREQAAPALADPEERLIMARDFLEEMHQIQVDRKGVVGFERMTTEARNLIGDFPVRLYHHTSTRVTERIRAEGLRPQPGADVNCLGSGSGAHCVFLTAEAGGVTPDVYLGTATRKHGGDPETLSVVVQLAELGPDDDDADLRSGSYQFTIPCVAPERIENFAAPAKAPRLVPAAMDV